MVQSNINTVISVDQLDFVPVPDKEDVYVANVDWFNLIQAKVFRYPKNYETPLHYLSGEILHVILKGKVEFQEKDGLTEIAEPGSFHICGKNPWRTKILEETYFLVVERDDTKTILVD